MNKLLYKPFFAIVFLLTLNTYCQSNQDVTVVYTNYQKIIDDYTQQRDKEIKKLTPKNYTSNKEKINLLYSDLIEKVIAKRDAEIQVITNKFKPNKEIKNPDPRPDKSTTDALSSILNGPKSDGTAKEGEGDDKTPGDKGSSDGDPNANSYYGTGKGLDGDGSYMIGGRKALNKEKFVQDCHEAGTVVVSIEVDRSGNVISAMPGVRGTTNNSKCLIEPARRAALATKFNADDKAPAKQNGKIIYRFSLSE